MAQHLHGLQHDVVPEILKVALIWSAIEARILFCVKLKEQLSNRDGVVQLEGFKGVTLDLEEHLLVSGMYSRELQMHLYSQIVVYTVDLLQQGHADLKNFSHVVTILRTHEGQTDVPH